LPETRVDLGAYAGAADPGTSSAAPTLSAGRMRTGVRNQIRTNSPITADMIAELIQKARQSRTTPSAAAVVN
jgi:hypothetical protein